MKLIKICCDNGAICFLVRISEKVVEININLYIHDRVKVCIYSIIADYVKI